MRLKPEGLFMCKKSSKLASRTRGFTLVELVMVMVMLGVLAVVAIPSMSTSGYRAQQFHDGVVSALRYAQKSAVSHRRMVCVDFNASTLTLTIDDTKTTTACATALNLPGTNSNVLTSADTTNAVFAPVPTAFSFQPNGTGADRTLSIAGQTDIIVVGATGYVQ